MLETFRLAKTLKSGLVTQPYDLIYFYLVLLWCADYVMNEIVGVSDIIIELYMNVIKTAI